MIQNCYFLYSVINMLINYSLNKYILGVWGNCLGQTQVYNQQILALETRVNGQDEDEPASWCCHQEFSTSMGLCALTL